MCSYTVVIIDYTLESKQAVFRAGDLYKKMKFEKLGRSGLAGVKLKT